MTSYAIDTNVLLGHSFLQNRWQTHTQRLFSTDNTVVASDQTVYEYCCKTHGKSRTQVDLNWSREEGVFARVKASLRDDAFMAEEELATRPEDELGPSEVAQVFIDEHDVEHQVKDRVRRYFRAELTTDCSRKEAREAIRDLVERITTVADERKEELSHRVKHTSAGRNTILTKEIARIISGSKDNEHPDANIISEAKALSDAGEITALVTGDKNDIYSNSETIQAKCSLPILYLKDKFADRELPHS